MTETRRVSKALAAAAALLAALPCAAATLRVLPERSDLVVVTRKAGFAAGLAHDHAVAASGYDARLEFTPDAPEGARFELTVPVEGLVVDDPALRSRIAPALERLGIRDGEFPEISGKDREKVRKAMLDGEQLDAAGHPTISASATVAGSDAGGEFPYDVALRLEVRGEGVERRAKARYTYEDGTLQLEAYASFAFTDFGIEPYSAFLGAVRNRDAFHVYVRLVAVVEDGP